MDLKQLIDVISQHVPITTLLVLILYGGYKRLWVWGYQLKDLEASCGRRIEELKTENKRWEELALNGTSLASRSTNVLGSVLTKQ